MFLSQSSTSTSCIPHNINYGITQNITQLVIYVTHNTKMEWSLIRLLFSEISVIKGNLNEPSNILSDVKISVISSDVIKRVDSSNLYLKFRFY